MPSAYSEQKTGNGQQNAAVREDIGGLMAELASRPQVNPGASASCPVRNARPC